jgi:hypothetical protein
MPFRINDARRDKSRLYTRRFIVETRFIASPVLQEKKQPQSLNFTYIFARGIAAEPLASPQVREAHAVEAKQVMERIARRKRNKKRRDCEAVRRFFMRRSGSPKC